MAVNENREKYTNQILSLTSSYGTVKMHRGPFKIICSNEAKELE